VLEDHTPPATLTVPMGNSVSDRVGNYVIGPSSDLRNFMIGDSQERARGGGRDDAAPDVHRPVLLAHLPTPELHGNHGAVDCATEHEQPASLSSTDDYPKEGLQLRVSCCQSGLKPDLDRPDALDARNENCYVSCVEGGLHEQCCAYPADLPARVK
jgi:hypothetical protein